MPNAYFHDLYTYIMCIININIKSKMSKPIFRRLYSTPPQDIYYYYDVTPDTFTTSYLSFDLLKQMFGNLKP